MANIRGKSFKAIAFDVSEGYVAVNPLFLKPLESDVIKGLYEELLKMQSEIRGEPIKHGDIASIRWRNMRLQRLYSAAMIIKNFARERRLGLS
ncbi:hypothetical protein BMS3Abin07_00306 [bacterium BMS3Abin07]|nr:hypothetical protein BMS3Abin07_00306 [bacterium BMS3Abin07]GBE31789.1 hypothetical protein BMS3Bbin05_00692 [bacterium BMS3Bbin05]HDO23385.1 hypothetical protein [Nitrospirota bacterium]HDZ87431.1 hypothetical protein [Nitrospirota bacterium]